MVTSATGVDAPRHAGFISRRKRGSADASRWRGTCRPTFYRRARRDRRGFIGFSQDLCGLGGEVYGVFTRSLNAPSFQTDRDAIAERAPRTPMRAAATSATQLATH